MSTVLQDVRYWKAGRNSSQGDWLAYKRTSPHARCYVSCSQGMAQHQGCQDVAEHKQTPLAGKAAHAVFMCKTCYCPWCPPLTTPLGPIALMLCGKANISSPEACQSSPGKGLKTAPAVTVLRASCNGTHAMRQVQWHKCTGHNCNGHNVNGHNCNGTNL